MKQIFLDNPSRCAKSGSPQRAFTRVELLAVVAALALLAGLILPAFARSGDDGARTICMNNLRQLGTASLMYADDNRDYLAFPDWGGGSDAAGWLYTPTGGVIPNPRDSLPWENDPVSAWKTGLWFPYVQNPKSYLCPVDIMSRTYTMPTAMGGRNNKLSSYVMNGAVCGYSSVYRSCRITDAWSPECYLLWGPNENANGPGNPGALEFNDGSSFPSQSEGIEQLHTPNGGEVLAVGGNVRFVSVRTWNAEGGKGSGPGGRTLAFWSPF